MSRNENKEIRKDLIKTSVLCLLTLVTLVVSSVAWFASNRNTAADSSVIQSGEQPNLVIAASVSELKSMTLANSSYEISFMSMGVAKLIPATHDWEIRGTDVGLKYNSNPRAVSAATGVKRDTTELEFSAVTSGSSKKYYVDYVAYIASLDEELPAKGLSVTGIELTQGTMSDYLKALSVDFYVGTPDVGTYKGTLNLASQDYENVKTTTNLKSLELTKGDIPVSTSNTPIVVTMRVYFDGALKEIENGGFVERTYIRSNQIDASQIEIRVNFEAPLL